MQSFKTKYGNIILIHIASLITLFSFVSCQKIDVEPPITNITSSSVYNNDVTAAAVLTGIYAKISSSTLSNPSLAVGNISLLASMSADDLLAWPGLSNPNNIAYYTNNLTAQPPFKYGTEIWGTCYTDIATCNSALEGLEKSSGLTPSVKKQLTGEALFMRAFLHFYLVNFYGDVPLVLGTDYKVNSLLGRTAKSKVYDQIIADLKAAEESLSPNFLDGTILKSTTERVRPTTWAAKALLARVYLYYDKYAEAEAKATEVISNNSQFGLTALDATFKKNSLESIWQLQPVNQGVNTEVARVLVIPSTGFSDVNPFYLNSDLVNSFEPGDERKNKWINSIVIGSTIYPYAFKYKSATLNDPVTEYLVVLRLAEQFLIRSEARTKLNNLSGAIADLDIIRQRAQLPLISNTNPGITKQNLLDAIMHERRVEFFTEWGHRWLDLKRLGTINDIMSVATAIKGGTWQPYKALYPVGDIPINPNLVQNPGY